MLTITLTSIISCNLTVISSSVDPPPNSWGTGVREETREEMWDNIGVGRKRGVQWRMEHR